MKAAYFDIDFNSLAGFLDLPKNVAIDRVYLPDPPTEPPTIRIVVIGEGVPYDVVYGGVLQKVHPKFRAKAKFVSWN